MIVGISGTRLGMTEAQRDVLGGILLPEYISALNHGDCVGVDVQAAKLAQERGIHTIAFPAWLTRYRAWHPSDEVKVVDESCTYTARNRSIVESSALMIIVPKDGYIQQKGGTAHAYRCAVRLGVPTWIIFPDGVQQRSDVPIDPVIEW